MARRLLELGGLALRMGGRTLGGGPAGISLGGAPLGTRGRWLAHESRALGSRLNQGAHSIRRALN
jgi:hypothetical protein